MTKIRQKDNNKKITQFFSSGRTSNEESASKKRTNEISKYYISKVKNQPERDECNQRECADEKRKLRRQLAQSKEKLALTKEAINICKGIIQQKDCKLNSLRSQLKEQLEAESGEESRRQLFMKYENDFSSAGLSELRSVAGKKVDDSKFVLIGLRFLYENQLHRLCNMSVTGRSKKTNKGKDNNDGKINEKMSPKKLESIAGVFTDRLNALKLDEKEHKQRAARMNIHINNAIQNLNPKKSNNQHLDDLNKQINLADSLVD